MAFIRGVGQTDLNFALEPGVGLYIDDVYYPTLTGSLADLMDLERVEIAASFLMAPTAAIPIARTIRISATQRSWIPRRDGRSSRSSPWSCCRGVSADVDWRFSDDYQLKSITAWRRYDSSWAQDVDGAPLSSQMLLQTLEHWQWSQELRLNGKLFDDAVDFTVGGFYFEQDGTLEARVNLTYAGIDFIHGPNSTPSTSYAGFFNARSASNRTCSTTRCD